MDPRPRDFDKQSQAIITLEKLGKDSGYDLEIREIDAESILDLSLDKPAAQEEAQPSPARSASGVGEIPKPPLDSRNLLTDLSLESKPEGPPGNEPVAQVQPVAENALHERVEGKQRSGSTILGKSWKLLICSLFVLFSACVYLFYVKGYSVSEAYKKVQKVSREQFRNLQRAAEHITEGSNEHEKMEPKKTDGKPVVIYSWTNERGLRVYSSKGFPDDKHFSDPKIEWK